MNLCGDAAAKLKVAPRPRRVDLLRLLAWRQRALEQGATLKGQRSRWPSNSTAAVTVTLMKSRLRRCELPRGPRPAALLWDASQEETLMRLSVDIWLPPPHTLQPLQPLENATLMGRDVWRRRTRRN